MHTVRGDCTDHQEKPVTLCDSLHTGHGGRCIGEISSFFLKGEKSVSGYPRGTYSHPLPVRHSIRSHGGAGYEDLACRVRAVREYWSLSAQGTFGEGIHLVSGDVGSGKSTLALLLAGLFPGIRNG